MVEDRRVSQKLSVVVLLLSYGCPVLTFSDLGKEGLNKVTLIGTIRVRPSGGIAILRACQSIKSVCAMGSVVLKFRSHRALHNRGSRSIYGPK